MSNQTTVRDLTNDEDPSIDDCLLVSDTDGGATKKATIKNIVKTYNSDLIKQFINQNNDCIVKPIQAQWGVDTGYGKQILTGQDNMDGFFYSCLEKK